VQISVDVRNDAEPQSRPPPAVRNRRTQSSEVSAPIRPRGEDFDDTVPDRAIANCDRLLRLQLRAPARSHQGVGQLEGASAGPATTVQSLPSHDQV
jgi:hypothetical protein